MKNTIAICPWQVIQSHSMNASCLGHKSSFYLPSSHCIPVHPTSQAQVSGAEQVPPFWQRLPQMATKVSKKKTMKVREDAN